MIELYPTTALVLYLFFTLATLLIIWTYSHRAEKKQSPPVERENLHTCEYCHCPYLNDAGEKLSQCPECGSYNKN